MNYQLGIKISLLAALTVALLLIEQLAGGGLAGVIIAMAIYLPIWNRLAGRL